MQFLIINEQYKENEVKILETIRLYVEKIFTKFDAVIRSLELKIQYIEKYIDKYEKGKTSILLKYVNN